MPLHERSQLKFPGHLFFCHNEKVGNLRCGGEKSFSSSAVVLIYLLYTNEMNKSHKYLPATFKQRIFFSCYFNFSLLQTWKKIFEPDLYWYLSHHKTALVRQYKSTVLLHKVLTGSHREGRTCSCSYLQLTHSAWKNPDSLCTTSSHS